MKEVTPKIPDSKLAFFMELTKLKIIFVYDIISELLWHWSHNGKRGRHPQSFICINENKCR